MGLLYSSLVLYISSLNPILFVNIHSFGDTSIFISNYIIDSIGSEIDNVYENEYSLFIEQIINDKRYYYNYDSHKINLKTKGVNLDNTPNIKLIPTIINDGNGYGAIANTTIHVGDGGLITSICGIDKINIDNVGSGYDGNSNNVKIVNGSNEIFSKIYKWDSIDKSLIFDSQEFLTYEYLKKFNKNWIFRDYNNIPIINNYNDYKMYDKNIVDSLEIMLNNKNREYITNIDLYNSLEKLEFWNNSSNKNITVYSFSLDNNSTNANGACNFSSFKDIKFKLKLKDMNEYDEDYKYNISIYFEYYNVKQYMNGIGAIKFAN